MQYREKNCKPLIVVGARVHPGESNSSFAIEGFMNRLFLAKDDLLKQYSFFILPMINPDGVICGFYRPALNGTDMNRSWRNPSTNDNSVSYNTCRILDGLTADRKIIFLLDFHGHTAQSNAFTYGVKNPSVFGNVFERSFPRAMASVCPFFDEKMSLSMPPNEYRTTMRVALHHRYSIPFAYTLEMSFGAMTIGPEKMLQMMPNHYRMVGESTVTAIGKMLAEHGNVLKDAEDSWCTCLKELSERLNV
jgi:hypothetical protein